MAKKHKIYAKLKDDKKIDEDLAKQGFESFPEGLDDLRKEPVYNRNWNDPNEIIKMRLRRAVSAEVLIPDIVPVDFIQGIYASCDESMKRIESLLASNSLSARIAVNKDIFFNT